jgi:hypothetical protein
VILIPGAMASQAFAQNIAQLSRNELDHLKCRNAFQPGLVKKSS